MLGRVRVAGHSMEPSLHHGDELLYLRIPPRVGSVVVARDPRDGDRLIIKRVAEMDRTGLVLESDRPDHERLRVPRRAVLGRAILRYRPFSLLRQA
jgi:phage repressor protein C with HTH and peptisase S24 domain